MVQFLGIIIDCIGYEGEAFNDFLKPFLLISSPDHGDIVANLLETLLKGEAVVLLDTVDEDYSNHYTDLIKKLHTFLKSYPRISTVIAGRIRDFPFSEDLQVSLCELQHLSDKDIETFIKLKKPSELAKVILDRLKNHDILGQYGIGRNPFWLHYLLIPRDVLKEHRTHILKEAVGDMLGRVVERKPGKPGQQDKQVDVLIGALAHLAFTITEKLTEKEQTEAQIGVLVEETEATKRLENWLQHQVSSLRLDAGIILEIAITASLIQQVGPYVKFRHNLLLEYFVAEHIQSLDLSKRPSDSHYWWGSIILSTGLMSKRKYEAWMTTLLEYCRTDSKTTFLLVCCLVAWRTRLPDIEAKVSILLKEMLESQDEEKETLCYAIKAMSHAGGDLAIQYLSCVGNQLTRNGRERTYTLLMRIQNRESIRQLVRGGLADRELVQSVIILLVKIRNDIVIEELIFALNDKDWHTKMHAAYALGDIGDERAIEPLEKKLVDENPNVRAGVSTALGSLGGETSVYSLVTALNESDPVARQAKIKALIALGSKAVDELIKALENRKSIVRSSAVKALRGIRDDRAIEPLVRLFNEEEHIEVKCEIVGALGDFGHIGVISSFIDTLENEDEQIREAVILALAHIGIPAVRPLVEALNDHRIKTRLGATLALGQIKNPEAVQPLIHILESDVDYDIRCKAAIGLGQIGDQRAIAPLSDALRSEVATLRSAAVDALIKFGDTAVERLVQAMSFENWKVRWRAIEALKEIGAKQYEEIFIEALKDGVVEVRRKAVEALGVIGDEQTVNKITDILEAQENIDRSFYEGAIEVLGRLGGSQRAAHLLIQHLQNSYMRDQRKRIAEILGRIGQPVAEELTTILANEDPEIRQNVLETLGRIRYEGVYPHLIHLLADPIPSVRESAAIAAGRLRYRDSVPPLIVALNDKNHKVRREAAIALGKIQDERAIIPLFNVFREALGEVNQRFRKEVVEALGQFEQAPSQEVINEAITVLENKEEDSIARLRAAQVLGYYPKEEAIIALIDALTDEPNVRVQVIRAIVRIGRSAVPYLIRTLADERPTVRKMAVELLGQIQDDTAIVSLHNLQNDNYYDESTMEFPIRRAAEDALLRFSRDLVIEKESLEVTVT